MFPGVSTGGGGLSASSSAASRSGDAGGSAGGAQFSFSFGGNPNATSNNFLMIGAVAAVGFYLWQKRK